jgi:hypothetical protein
MTETESFTSKLALGEKAQLPRARLLPWAEL